MIVYFSQVMKAAKSVYGIFLPLLLGFIIAYVVNILMSFLERHYFPRSKQPWITKTSRPVCLLLSYILILLILAAVITLVLPKVVDTIRALSLVLPEYWEQIRKWIGEHQDQWSFVNEWMDGDSLSWNSIADSLRTSAPQSISGILTSSISLLSGLTSGLFDLVVGLAFSVYLLAGKEKLLAQARKLQKAFVKPSTAARLNTVLAVANESFTSFITGQCTEAVILGPFAYWACSSSAFLCYLNRHLRRCYLADSHLRRLSGSSGRCALDFPGRPRQSTLVYCLYHSAAAAGRESDLPQGNGHLPRSAGIMGVRCSDHRRRPGRNCRNAVWGPRCGNSLQTGPDSG